MNNAIREVECNVLILINKIKEEECILKTQIRNEERNLLSKVRENPVKWNSQNLKFKTRQIATAAYLTVECLKQMSEFMLQREFTPVGHDYNLIGKTSCHKNFNLAFECYFDKDGCIAIGEWFELNFSAEGAFFVMFLKQSNGLFTNNDIQFVSVDGNTHLSYAIKKRFRDEFTGKWNKAISSNVIFRGYLYHKG